MVEIKNAISISSDCNILHRSEVVPPLKVMRILGLFSLNSLMMGEIK